MDRRAFLGTVAGGLLAAPLAAEAQQAGAAPRIGLLGPGGPGPGPEEFQRSLSALGYVEGRNIHFERRWAQNKVDRLPELAAELVQAKVDVIVAIISSAAKAAQQATTTIPIVMVGVGDPVALGLVTSLGRPGGNITGTTSFGPELGAKRLQLLKELIPGLKRVAVLWNPTNPLHELSLKGDDVTARALGVELLALRASSLDEIESGVRAGTQGRADALIVYGDGALLSRNGTRIAALALDGRLPTVFVNRLDVQAGGLMAYTPNIPHMYRRAATYVDRILKGAKPADLPVEEPTTFELVINLKTAKTLGLTIPPSLLQRADQ
jgi:putative ABC transport system substrate-binding protein